MRRKALPILVLSSWLFAACSEESSKTDAGAPADGQQVADARTPDGPEVCDQLLPTSFPKDTVLKKGCYLCKQTPQITDGVKITIEPGVRIVFYPDTALRFSGNDILIAAGTAAEPIVFTGSQKQRGHWIGLVFDGTLKPDSTLDYVTVEYAGNTGADKDGAGVKLSADSRGVRLSITNTTVRESQGWGLNLGGSAVVAAFGKNTLTGNTLGPAYVASEVVSVLDAASTYKGNDRDQLVVRAYRTKGTWATLDVPYYLDGGISADGDWTIQEGATLIMSDNSRIGISEQCSLSAKGTATRPILFTAASKKRGAWEGLRFDGCNNTRNALDYVTVEYGGNTKADKDSAGVKMTADSRGVQLSMKNTTIRESQGWGLYLGGSSVLPGFTGNTLTKNTLGPVSAGSEAAHQLLSSSTYTGNDVDRVVVQGGYVSKAVTWEDLKVPYLVRSSLRPNHAVLTLSPGVTLLMDEHGYIEVGGDDGGLHAVGTASDPIVITGLTKTAGYWDSIVFDTTLNSANALDYCTVEHGGGGTAKGWKGMIVAQSDSHGVKVSIKHSKVQNSAGYGVWKGMYAQVDLTDTTFSGCASGEVFTQQ